MAGRPQFDWTSESIALLGTMPDRQIARKLGITPVMVAYQRKLLGIEKFTPQSAWAPENDHLLGTVTDAALAEKLGVAKHTVLNRRRELGVPAFGPRGWPAWPEDQLDILGTIPDTEIAQQVGRSVSAVRQQRMALGIKAFHEHRGVIKITPDLRAKLEELEPVLLQRYRDAGLPIDRLEPWQIVEIALSELLASARKAPSIARSQL
ncbi:hypothetical protein YS110_02025 [Acidovorax sp. YS12]|nr:hypothetical protein YS110_02025 [Acidovorax sp. YS12]